MPQGSSVGGGGGGGRGEEGRVGRVVDDVLPVLAADAVDGVAERGERLDADGVVALGVADVGEQRQAVRTRRTLGTVLERNLLELREGQQTAALGHCRNPAQTATTSENAER